MKITIIYGQNHKGSTYHIARMVADKVLASCEKQKNNSHNNSIIGNSITEFFLPRDFGEFCVGCSSCFLRGEEKCPHAEKLHQITSAMDDADLIIFASPVYVYHATGAMKAFLDHYGWRWMVHRPEEKMFSKQALCISTAAGSGTKSTNKDMADSLFFWGVPKIYQYGINVAATSFSKINPKKLAKIERDTTKIAEKIVHNDGKVKVGLKTKGFFLIMRMIQKKSSWNEIDCRYWNERGWNKKNRPWK